MLPVVISLSWDCTQKCIFCHWVSKEGMNTDSQSWYLAEIKKKVLLFYKKSPFRECMLIGNEPTNFQFFFEFLHFLKSIGVGNIYIQTTWENFSDMDFTQKSFDLGVKGLYLPLYWNQEVHDKVTQTSGAYEKFIIALWNINQIWIQSYFHTILIKQNYPFQYESDFNETEMIIHYPYKDNTFPYSHFALPLDKIKVSDRKRLLPFILPCLGVGIASSEVILHYSRGHIGNRIRISAYGISIEKKSPIFSYAQKCFQCVHYKQASCTWVYSEYLDLFWEEEFNPIFSWNA